MKLPFGDQAIVPESKLVDYLLSETHPEGQSKAVFFRRFGFAADEPETLRRALLYLASTAEMTETFFAFGTKYVGVGEVIAPNGARVRLTTVWVISEAGPPPILVTAYPA